MAITSYSAGAAALPQTISPRDDSETTLAGDAASTITQIGTQYGLNKLTRRGSAIGRIGAEAAKTAESGIAKRLIGKAATAIGVTAATGAGIAGSEIIGGALAATGAASLAWSVAQLGIRATTGYDINKSALGRGIEKVENGAIHMATNGAGKILDSLGMRDASNFTRGTLAQFLTGESGTPEPAKSAPEKHSVMVMTPGPARPMTSSDWREPRYQLASNGPEPYPGHEKTSSQPVQRITTTPMGRASGIMNALSSDAGMSLDGDLSRASGYSAQKSTAISKTTRAPSRSNSAGLD